MRELDLTAGLSGGSKECFQQIIRLYFKEVYHHVISLTKSEEISKTIVKEAFRQAWKNRLSFDSTESLENYLFETAGNLSLNYLKQVAGDETLQAEVWNSCLRTRSSEAEEVTISSEQENSIKTIHNNILQWQLTPKLSTEG